MDLDGSAMQLPRRGFNSRDTESPDTPHSNLRRVDPLNSRKLLRI